MKKLIMSSLIVFMIFTVQKTWAQRPPSDRIDHLKTELNLTDDQVTQLEKIFESRHQEMQALRSADYKSREEKREAMQGFRESMEKEIEVVLDETQYAKFQEIKKERRGEHGPKGERMGHHKHFKDEKGKELHAQIKAYKDENIKPVMLKQREKLESKIAKADKKLIAEMRVDFEKMKAKREARFSEMKSKREAGEKPDFKKKQKEGKKWGSDEKHEKMKTLVEKYKDDIDPLFAEIAPQQEKWEKDIETIKQKTLGADSERMQRGGKHKHQMNGDRFEMRKMTHFLLLDPNEKIDVVNIQSKVVKVTAFPNPASTATTIEYEVLEDGQVLIELRNGKGKLLKTLKNEAHKKGKHSVTISLETYKNDLFYVIIKDKNGIVTTKNIVRVK